MNRKGFSLIETVIAMVILSGAIIVLTNSWGGSMLAVRKSRQLNATAMLLQKKMTELEILYEGKPFSEVKEEEEGDFDEEYPDYRWKMKAKKIEVPDMTAGLSSRDGGVNEMELMVVRKLTEYIEKSVMELKVTVIKTTRGKEQEFSATTYLIDLTQNLAAVGP